MGMTDKFNTYIADAAETRQYPTDDVRFAYVLLGANGEVAELRNALRQWEPLLFKYRLERARLALFGRPLPEPALLWSCISELGDVAWYIAMICFELGIVPMIHEGPYPSFERNSAVDSLAMLIDYMSQDVKRYYRDSDRTEFPKTLRDNIRIQVGMCIACMQDIAEHLGVTLDYVLDQNIDKLRRRAARDVIKGSGDER